MDRVEVVKKILSTEQKMQRLNIFAEIGIPWHLGLGLLIKINERDGEIKVGELAVEMNASLPNVSRALRNMEKEGKITRITDEKDRRNTLLKITEEGKTFLGENVNRFLSFFVSALDRLSDEDLIKYLEVSTAIYEASRLEVEALKVKA